MFHWICPECGREIAPGVKDCPACDPQAEAVPVVDFQVAQPPIAATEVVAAEPVKVLIPEIVGADPDVRLREMVGRMRGMAPQPAMQPAAAGQASGGTMPPAAPPGPLPIAAQGRSPVSAPAMAWVPAAPNVPDVAKRLEDTTLREPQAVSPEPAPVRGSLRGTTPKTGVQKAALPPSSGLGALGQRLPGAAPIQSIEEQMAARIQAIAPLVSRVAANVVPEESLPGPRLPHELSTFQGAGISSILRVVPDAPRRPLGSAIPGWVVTSLVTATLLAGTLSFAFYAMPGLANPRPKAVSTPSVETVGTGSPLVEVTGIRIVAGSRKGPEIRYLVVNHSGSALDGTTVNVTLRLKQAAAGAAPISRFAFTASGLAAYESREMVSPIQNTVLPGQLPDWRELWAEVEVQQ